MNIVISLLLGVVAAMVLAVSWPYWMLTQWEGPVSFMFLWFPVVFPFLLLAVFKNGVSRTGFAILSGLVFGLPIAGSCWYIAIWGESMGHHRGQEMGRFAIASLMLPAVVFLYVGRIRSAKQRLKEDFDVDVSVLEAMPYDEAVKTAREKYVYFPRELALRKIRPVNEEWVTFESKTALILVERVGVSTQTKVTIIS